MQYIYKYIYTNNIYILFPVIIHRFQTPCGNAPENGALVAALRHGEEELVASRHCVASTTPRQSRVFFEFRSRKMGILQCYYHVIGGQTVVVSGFH